jgi:hypothetical protein
LLARRGSEALLAVYRYDLPAAQAFSGNSDLLIAPAWRLPRELRDWIEAGHGCASGRSRFRSKRSRAARASRSSGCR